MLILLLTLSPARKYRLNSGSKYILIYYIYKGQKMFDRNAILAQFSKLLKSLLSAGVVGYYSF